MPYCSSCGQAIGDEDTFCRACGRRQRALAAAHDLGGDSSPTTSEVVPGPGESPGPIGLADGRTASPVDSDDPASFSSGQKWKAVVGVLAVILVLAVSVAGVIVTRRHTSSPIDPRPARQSNGSPVPTATVSPTTETPTTRETTTTQTGVLATASRCPSSQQMLNALRARPDVLADADPSSIRSVQGIRCADGFAIGTLVNASPDAQTADILVGYSGAQFRVLTLGGDICLSPDLPPGVSAAAYRAVCAAT